jgi:hypothetical protein
MRPDRVMAEGERIRIAVADHAETRQRDVALRAHPVEEIRHLRIEASRIPPFDSIDALQDERSEKVLQQEDPQGEDQRNGGREVEVDHHPHSHREDQPE